jgi:hypothetical protein
MGDELIDAASDELSQAIDEWNATVTQLSPEGRIRLANTYALVSIARSLHQLANGQPAQLDQPQFDQLGQLGQGF